MKLFLTDLASKQKKQLSKIEQRKIDRKIVYLESNPFLGKKLAGQYKEIRTIRAWPYRIFYYINYSKKEIWIVSILHRQGAYN